MHAFTVDWSSTDLGDLPDLSLVVAQAKFSFAKAADVCSLCCMDQSCAELSKNFASSSGVDDPEHELVNGSIPSQTHSERRVVQAAQAQASASGGGSAFATAAASAGAVQQCLGGASIRLCS